MVEDRVSLSVARRYDAAPERVYDAWIRPELACRFLFSTADGEIVRIDLEPVVGGRMLIVDRREGEDIEHVGKYLELDRPHRLVFSFAVPRYSSEVTVVTLDLERESGGCRLALTHDGVLHEWADSTRQGWTQILEGLAKVVE